MIRMATIDDIPHILPLAERFLSESPLGGKTFINRGDLSRTLENMILNHNNLVLVMELEGKIVGMSGALMFPFYANADYKIAQELFWFVDKANRGNGGEMLKRMESWAKSKGAKAMNMISLETKSVKVLDKYYRREGYEPIEHTYSKEL